MSDLPAIYSGLNRIRPTTSGSVLSIYTISVVGDRSATPRRHPLQIAGWSRYVHTQTYDDGGRLVESPAPPTLDIRI